jgi:two-component system CheB/CheR fusion protein
MRRHDAPDEEAIALGWSLTSGSAPPHLDVLVVGGDGTARSTLMALVRTFRVSVRGARHGDDAFHLIVERLADVVLCDIETPGLDGIGFVRRLRQDSRFRRILIVATTESGSGDTAMARESGFDGHIVKPVTPEALARVLDRALDLRQDSGHGRSA